MDPAVYRYSAERLRGPPAVIVENATEPCVVLNRGIHVDPVTATVDQSIIESLMISLNVVVLRVLSLMAWRRCRSPKEMI
jgi:hypothetical protein